MANKQSCYSLLITGLLGIAVTGCEVTAEEQQPAGPPPAPVKVSAASRVPMASVIQAPGTVVSRHDARIAAEIAGRLTWVADLGEEIEAGQLLARIDDRALQLQLQDNHATIKRLEANLKYLEQQLTRQQRLAQQNIAATDQVDETLAQRDMAEQDLAQARVARAQTLYQIELSGVTAPFSGRIAERLAQVGEYTTVGGTIARLVDTHNIEVRAQAPMSVAPHLMAGMPVTVADETHRIESEIRTVIPIGDERSRMIEVRLTLADNAWVIGSAVRVALPQSEPVEVVAVPRDALILRQSGTYLYKLTDAGTVEQVDVQTGIGNGTHIEVRGNVSDGDQVVIRGGERLQPGQSVTIGNDS